MPMILFLFWLGLNESLVFDDAQVAAYIRGHLKGGALESLDPGMTNKLRAEAYEGWGKVKLDIEAREKKAAAGNKNVPTRGAMILRDYALDVTWVLVRQEWGSYQLASGQLDKRSAAWRLEIAIKKLEELTANGSATVQQAQRVFLARNYRDAVGQVDETTGRYTEDRLRKMARVELAQIVSPSSIADENRDIQKPIRETFTAASDSLVRATIAKDRAGEALVTVFGADPKSLEAALAKLSVREQDYFNSAQNSEEVKKVKAWFVQRIAKNGGKGPSSLLETYGKLRERLFSNVVLRSSDAVSLGIPSLFDKDRPLPFETDFGDGIRSISLAPPELEEFFQNKAKDDEIRKLLKLIATFKKEPNGLKEPFWTGWVNRKDIARKYYLPNYLIDPSLQATSVEFLMQLKLANELTGRVEKILKDFETNALLPTGGADRTYATWIDELRVRLRRTAEADQGITSSTNGKQ